MMVNHTQAKFPLGTEMVVIERGSCITSELKLMDRWGWSKTKVRTFLDLLQNDSMLVKKTDHKKTTLTVVNYSVWQDSETTEEPIKNQKRTIKKPKKDTNKNVKNVNNEKNEEVIHNTVFENAINDFKEFRIKVKKPMTERAVELLRMNLDKLASDDETKIKILEQSIVKGWTDVYKLKDNQQSNTYQQPTPPKKISFMDLV